MSQQNYRAPAREKTFGDYPAFKLLAPRNAEGKQPSLMMYVHPNTNNSSNSEVRFVVFTQTQEQDPKKQKIEAKMNLVDAVTVMKAIQKAANSTEAKLENMVAQTYRPKDFKNRQAGNIEDVKIIIGKNAGGVFLSLVSWNIEVPRILFHFGFGDMFAFIANEEKGQTFVEFSELRALAHSSILEDVMRDEMKRVWRPWVPQNNNGGGNNNYQNNNNQQRPAQASYQDAQAELDDIFG